MNEPPIQNVDSIDIVGRRKDGDIELFIVASGPLDPSPQTQQLLLDKIQSYLEQLNSQAFQAEFDHPRADQVRIVVSCDFGIDPIMRLLVERARPWVAENNARIEIEGKAHAPRRQ